MCINNINIELTTRVKHVYLTLYTQRSLFKNKYKTNGTYVKM